MNDFTFLCALTLKASMAVLYAALGEVIAERSGIINLGLEGMLLFGAMTGFAVGHFSGSAPLAFAAAGGACALLAGLHGLFAIRFGANQLLSGIALTILGTGLANYLGRPLIGLTGPRLSEAPIPLLHDIPGLGPVLFNQNLLVYLGFALTGAVWFLLTRTRWGLTLRACGENPAAADAMGVNVARTRCIAVMTGGCFAGLGGAYLSLAFTPGWKEGMSGGQGWIAVAIVIFAGWRPFPALAGALLFGILTAAQFLFQATGQQLVPTYILRILPYLLTILTLSVAVFLGRKSQAPAGLGQPFYRER